MITREPKPRFRTTRLLGVTLPVVLALGAVGGGVAYTKKTTDEADRTVPTALWSKEQHKPGKDPAGDAILRGRSSTPMSKLLLPVPDGYRLGPDMGELSNDDEVSGTEATRQLKDFGRGLAGKDRREFEKKVDKLGVRGLAARSYFEDSDELYLEVKIVRMKDRRHIRDMHDLQTKLAGALELKKGPKIKGHAKAACFMVPTLIDADGHVRTKKPETEGMECTAYTDEIQVTVTATGVKPLDRSEVADFVKQQLDHIASPGEYV
ncbi:hypothetical protein AB0H29_15695 [Streptomyces thermolilacinus]